MSSWLCSTLYRSVGRYRLIDSISFILSYKAIWRLWTAPLSSLDRRYFLFLEASCSTVVTTILRPYLTYGGSSGPSIAITFTVITYVCIPVVTPEASNPLSWGYVLPVSPRFICPSDSRRTSGNSTRRPRVFGGSWTRAENPKEIDWMGKDEGQVSFSFSVFVFVIISYNPR